MAIKFLHSIDVDGEVQGTSLDINGNADISGSLTITGAILNNVENASLDIYGGNDTTNDAHIKLHGNANNYGSMELNYGYDATNSYFKVKQGSTENFVLQGGNATFAGDITVGDDLVVTDDATVGGDFTSSGYVQSHGILYLRNSIQVVNKAGNGWLNLAVRETSGSEALYNLDNIGNIITTALDVNGNADISGNLHHQGILYQTSTQGGGFYAPMVKNGALLGGSSTTTGRLRIKIPHYAANAMQSFIIDVYEYNTDRMQSIQVGGYSYNPGDGSAPWYNTSAIALMDSDNRDLAVRFGYDTSASANYVAVGETNTTWTYPQVVIRNYMSGHSTSSSEFLGAFTIEFVTTDGASYNSTHTDNQPFAHWGKIESIPANVTNALPTTGGTMSGTITMGGNNINGGGTIGGTNFVGTSNYHEFGNATGSVSNDGTWNGRLNVAGTSHARLDVKSVSDGIITSMYAHTGNAAGRIGTMSNHPVNFIVNGSVRGTLDSSSNFAATTFSGDLNGTINSSTTATTQSASNNSTKVATTAYVDAQVATVIDSAPGTLNTLNELAAALGDDASFSTTVTNSIATKLPLAGGTMTGDLTITKSDGDTVLIIESDTDNNNENDNPRLEFKQDGGAVFGHVGTTGNVNNPFTNALTNYTYLRASTGLQFVVNSTTSAMTIDTSGNFVFNGDIDINGAADISGALTGVDAITMNGALSGATTITASGEIEGGSLDINGNADISGSITNATWAGDTIAANKIATLNQNTTGSSGSCTGNAATATVADQATNLNAIDDRDMAPEDRSYSDDFRIFFTSKEGLEDGTSVGSNWQDALFISSYSDSSGGNPNVLAFDKSEKKIYHYQASATASNWGTPKQLAYMDSVLTTAAQTNITSLGTLTTLTVDNIRINGTTIGHTSDTDLMTLTSGKVDVTGELECNSLDVNGNADISGNLTGVDNLTMTGNLTTGNGSIECGDLDVSGTITGDGSSVDSINAGNISSGTLAVGRGGTGLTSISTLLNSNVTSVSGNAGSVTNGVYTNTTQTISGAKTFSGNTVFSGAISQSNTTQSTNKSSGAIKTNGGVGIAKTLNVGEDVVAYASSDKRYKDNLQAITNPIDKVKSLTGYTFTWNDKHEQFNGNNDIGVVAQEVEKVFPEIVDTRDNGYKAVKYEKMVAVLIEAVKDQQKQIDELKAIVDGNSK